MKHRKEKKSADTFASTQYIRRRIDPGHVGVQHMRMPIDRRGPQRAETTLAFPIVTQSGVVLLREILSIKIMNRSGDNTHSCRRPTRTPNESHLLLLIQTWLLQSLYKDRMAARRRPLIRTWFLQSLYKDRMAARRRPLIRNMVLTIIVQRLNGCQKTATDSILFQDVPQQVSRYPFIGLFQVYKRSVDWFGEFPSHLEDLTKCEQLVSCSSSWAKAALGVLDLWLDYHSAFPLQNSCMEFSREA